MKAVNSIHSANRNPSQPPTFHPFTRLPTELRLQIWQLSIQRTRIVTVMLLRGTRGTGDATGGYRRTNHLGNVISGDHYVLQIPQERRNDTLLGTCCEARRVALAFFRVRIPLQPWRPYGPRLYMNPEYDYLYIYSGTVAAESLIGLLNDIRAFDTQGRGLLHLACSDLRLVNEEEEPFPLSDEALSPAQIMSFRESLRSLETLWFVADMIPPTHILGRGIIQARPAVMARGGVFEVLKPYPRLVEEHFLKAVFLPKHGHTMRRKWQSWEKELGVAPTDDELAKCRREISIAACNQPLDPERKPTLQQGDGSEIEDTYIPPVEVFWIMPVDEIDKHGKPVPEFNAHLLDFNKTRFSWGSFDV